MHKTEEIVENKETNKRKPLNHVACIPCEKHLCGRAIHRISSKPKPAGFDPDMCVVCADIWKSIHCCPYCGRNGNEMWGK